LPQGGAGFSSLRDAAQQKILPDFEGRSLVQNLSGEGGIPRFFLTNFQILCPKAGQASHPSGTLHNRKYCRILKEEVWFKT